VVLAARAADERPRTPWTFPVSLFKEYKPETPQLLNDCFEFDWAIIKKPKLKNATEDEVKEKMRAMYPFIQQVYRRLSASGIAGIIFCVGWNVFREFMTQTLCITDKTHLKPDDVDRLFIGVNAGQHQKKGSMNPDKALVRFEFLEILLRCALKKYLESGETDSETAALQLLWEDYLEPHQQDMLMNPSTQYFYD
jgi:NLR family CARD domain-containing protein 3